MLHQILLVALLDRARHDIAPYKSSVNKINFKVAVGAHLYRLPKVSVDPDAVLLRLDRHKLVCDVPSVDAVDDLPEIAVAGRMELHLASEDQLKGNIRSGECKMLHQIRDIASLRGRLAQKFPPHRRVEKEIPHKKGRSVRRTHLVKGNLSGTLKLYPAAGKAVRRLRYHLNL